MLYFVKKDHEFALQRKWGMNGEALVGRQDVTPLKKLRLFTSRR